MLRIEDYASFRRVATPFYYYDIDLFQRTADKVAKLSKDYGIHVHYSLKANSDMRLNDILSSRGIGADCVSGDEIDFAVSCGYDPKKIFFAGVAKSDKEICQAFQVGIGAFVVESLEEIEIVSDIARRLGRKAPMSLRINPNIDPHTHHYITTGLYEDKFGISDRSFDEAVAMVKDNPYIDFFGLQFHIGSQILDMSDFVALCNRIDNLTDRLERLRLPVGDLNVGGGLGINYEHPNHLPIADFKAYFDTFKRHLHLRPGQALHFELGRSLVAPCGTLICRVLYVKQGTTRQFAIVDGSMTELIRPALYHAYHRIENLTSSEPEQLYDVVGPVCESSDVFAKGVSLDACRRGDFIAIRSAGAYGESMASTYNGRPLPGAFFFE